MVNADPFSIVMLLGDSWRWGVTKGLFFSLQRTQNFITQGSLPFLKSVPTNLHAKRLQIKQQRRNQEVEILAMKRLINVEIRLWTLLLGRQL